MAISVITLAHDSTADTNHEAIGSQWCTIPDSVCALLATIIGESEDDYPQLRRIRSDQAIEYTGHSELEQLILETERIPGSEPDLRSAMGKLHGAAATAFFANLMVSCRPTNDIDPN